METIFKTFANSLLLGGTVGAYAMLSVVLIIVGYFRYLKPFLSEFYSLRSELIDGVETQRKTQESLKEFEDSFYKISEKIELNREKIEGVLFSQGTNNYKSLKNLLDGIEKEIITILNRTEKVDVKTDNSHRDIMVEFAKLQTRLEYMNPTMVRGIQK